MATIEAYAAKSVYDPPLYAQAVKVTGAQTMHPRGGRGGLATPRLAP